MMREHTLLVAGHIVRILTLAVAGVMFLSAPAWAQVFKCVEERSGKVVFSDVPCHGKTSGRAVDATPNTIDASGSREQALRREVQELRERMGNYESASKAGRSPSDQQSPRIDSRACEQARRSYDIEAGAFKQNKAAIEAKRSAMYGACGMREPTRIEINNEYRARGYRRP